MCIAAQPFPMRDWDAALISTLRIQRSGVGKQCRPHCAPARSCSYVTRWRRKLVMLVITGIVTWSVELQMGYRDRALFSRPASHRS
jgi:hypothetical protein